MVQPFTNYTYAEGYQANNILNIGGGKRYP